MKKWLFLCILPAIMLMSFSAYAATAHETDKRHHREHAVVNHSPVDINTATVAQLEVIKGIGPKKAEAIVAYREQHGSFKTVADLKNVRGFGAGLVDRLEKENPGLLVVKNSG